MNCMKCGREIPLGQVFCKDCLEDMSTHPIKPGTPVVVPVHDTPVPQRRAPIRRVRKPEEQLLTLKRMVLILSILLVAVSAAFAITTSVLVQRLEQAQNTRPPGQNYSVETGESETH